MLTPEASSDSRMVLPSATVVVTPLREALTSNEVPGEVEPRFLGAKRSLLSFFGATLCSTVSSSDGAPQA